MLGFISEDFESVITLIAQLIGIINLLATSWINVARHLLSSFKV